MKKSKKTKYKWVRTGRCNPKSCGAFCCRIGPLMISIGNEKKDKERKLYYESTGLVHIGSSKQKTFKKPESKKKTWEEIHHYAMMNPCKHLKNLRCNIHKKRPFICKDFPEDPNQVWYKLAKKHGCTYRFKRVKVKEK